MLRLVHPETDRLFKAKAAKRERIRELLFKAWWRADTPMELKFVRTMFMLYGFQDPTIGGK